MASASLFLSSKTYHVLILHLLNLDVCLNFQPPHPPPTPRESHAIWAHAEGAAMPSLVGDFIVRNGILHQLHPSVDDLQECVHIRETYYTAY